MKYIQISHEEDTFEEVVKLIKSGKTTYQWAHSLEQAHAHALDTAYDSVDGIYGSECEASESVSYPYSIHDEDGKQLFVGYVNTQNKVPVEAE